MLTSCDILPFVTMNPFDIIVYVALAWALVSGWWRGLAVQLLSLAGVVAALFFM